MVEILRNSGYSINLCGKNHSYLREEDFDFFSLYNHGGGGRAAGKSEAAENMDRWLKTLVSTRIGEEPSPCTLEGHPTYRIVSDAIECIDSHGDNPFFLWLSIPDPHPPYQVPEPYFSLFPEESVPERTTSLEDSDRKGWKWRWQSRVFEHKNPGYDGHYKKYRSVYCGMIRLIDDQLKRLMEHLEKKRLRDRTLIIFTSDHGDFGGEYGQMRKGLDLPECLIRVPLIILGPGVEARTLPEPLFVSLVDIMPTVCEMLGREIPYGVQGRSLMPILANGSFPQEEFRSIYSEVGFGGLYYGDGDDPPVHVPMDSPGYDTLNCVTQSGNTKMVRRDEWKLIFDMLGNCQIYNLSTDPFETENLYNDPRVSDVQPLLLEELLKWTIRTEDDLPRGSYIPKRVHRNWYGSL
jgi:arylsulfatase A-like enzyme